LSQSIATVEQLVAAREARGLSADDITRQLKLAPRQVQAIEQGDWSALPGLAFVRGVLRGYGRVLDADLEPLIATVSASMHAADLRPSASLDQPLPSRSMLGFGSGGSGSRLVWAGLVLLGVVALALFFGGSDDLSEIRSWLSRPSAESAAPTQPSSGDSRDSPTTTETVPLPVAPGAVPAPGTAAPAVLPSPTGTGAATAQSAPAAPGAAPGAAASAGSVAPAATPVAAPADGARPAGGRVLRLRFAKDAWVEVKGPQGAVLLSGVQKADSSRDLPLAGGVSLVIGNADAVRIELDGQPVDLAPHTKATVARLSLP